MLPSFKQLLSRADDFEFCDGVVLLLVQRYGNGADASAVPEKAAVVPAGNQNQHDHGRHERAAHR